MILYSPGLVQDIGTIAEACAVHADLCDILHAAISTAGSTSPQNCHGRMMMLRLALTEAVILAEALCPPDIQALPPMQ